MQKQKVTQDEATAYALNKMTDFGYEGLQVIASMEIPEQVQTKTVMMWQVICQYEFDGEIYQAHWYVWPMDDGNLQGEW